MNEQLLNQILAESNNTSTNIGAIKDLIQEKFKQDLLDRNKNRNNNGNNNNNNGNNGNGDGGGLGDNNSSNRRNRNQRRQEQNINQLGLVIRGTLSELTTFGKFQMGNTASVNNSVNMLSTSVSNIAGLMSNIPVIGNLAMPIQMVTSAATTFYNMVQERAKTFTDFTESGLYLAKGVTGLSTSARNTQLSLDELSPILMQNSVGLNALNGAYEDGIDRFTQLTKRVTEAQLSTSMYAISQKKIIEIAARQMKMEKMRGSMEYLKSIDNQQRTESFIRTLVSMTNIMGRSIDEILNKKEQDQIKPSMITYGTNLENRVGKSEEERNNITDALSTVSASSNMGSTMVDEIMSVLNTGKLTDSMKINSDILMPYINEIQDYITKNNINDPDKLIQYLNSKMGSMAKDKDLMDRLLRQQTYYSMSPEYSTEYQAISKFITDINSVDFKSYQKAQNAPAQDVTQDNAVKLNTKLNEQISKYGNWWDEQWERINKAVSRNIKQNTSFMEDTYNIITDPEINGLNLISAGIDKLNKMYGGKYSKDIDEINEKINNSIQNRTVLKDTKILESAIPLYGYATQAYDYFFSDDESEKNETPTTSNKINTNTNNNTNTNTNTTKPTSITSNKVPVSNINAPSNRPVRIEEPKTDEKPDNKQNTQISNPALINTNSNPMLNNQVALANNPVYIASVIEQLNTNFQKMQSQQEETKNTTNNMLNVLKSIDNNTQQERNLN